MLTMMMLVIPDADPLPMPAPPWMLWSLLLLTFFLHLIAMNFVLGGSIITAVSRLTGGGEDAAKLNRWLGKMMPTMVAAAITFGVAPLLFLQALYGRLFFTSAILMGWFWFAVVPILIVAYYGTYTLAFRKNSSGGGAAWIAVVVALIFGAVAFIYSNNMTLMLRPESFLPLFLESARGIHLNLEDVTLIPRYLHMLLGAVAVAGFVVAVYGAVKVRSESEHGLWAMRRGALWFVAATAINVLTGIWWLGVLPREVMLRFMGRSPVATISLAAGIIAGFVALYMMLSVVRSDRPRPLVMRSIWALLLTLVAMVVSRDEVRRGMLELAEFQTTTWIEPQWGVIAIFLSLLAGGVAATVWMAVVLLRSKPVAG
ncbi:MAG TPA: hypothetical protein VF701_21910 [Thermoanaerobaculia bacterium]